MHHRDELGLATRAFALPAARSLRRPSSSSTPPPTRARQDRRQRDCRGRRSRERLCGHLHQHRDGLRSSPAHDASACASRWPSSAPRSLVPAAALAATTRDAHTARVGELRGDARTVPTRQAPTASRSPSATRRTATTSSRQRLEHHRDVDDVQGNGDRQDALHERVVDHGVHRQRRLHAEQLQRSGEQRRVPDRRSRPGRPLLRAISRIQRRRRYGRRRQTPSRCR